MPAVATGGNANPRLPDSPSPLFRHANHLATTFANAARDGHPLFTGQILDLPDVPAEEINFLLWAAELGYREGIEVGA